MRTPRTLHGAKNRGWRVVEINSTQRIIKNVSHLGLAIWTDRNAKSKFISIFAPGNVSCFAFENAADAEWFRWRWS